MKTLGNPLNLIVSGVGGQGNILVSRLIGSSLSRKGYQVTIGETFGAAQRGGAVYSSLRIATNRLYGPMIPKGHADVILSLEPLEALRALNVFGKPSTVTISNTQPVLPVGVLSGRLKYPDLADLRNGIRRLSRQTWFVDATEMAIKLGAPITANIIMLGSLIGSRAFPISYGDVSADICNRFEAEKAGINLQALEIGYRQIYGDLEKQV